jgi:hypothetical protein
MEIPLRMRQTPTRSSRREFQRIQVSNFIHYPGLLPILAARTLAETQVGCLIRPVRMNERTICLPDHRSLRQKLPVEAAVFLSG